MPLKAECPFCGVIIKNLADDSREVAVECARCHNFFALPDAEKAPEVKKPVTQPVSGNRKRSIKVEPPKPKTIEENVVLKPSLERDEAPVPSRIKSLWGVAALFLGSFAFLLVTIKPLVWVAVGLGAVGILLGALGVKFSDRSDGTPLFPIAGATTSVVAMLFGAVYWAMSSGVSEIEIPKFDPSQSVKVSAETKQGQTAAPSTVYSPISDLAWPGPSDTVQQGNIRIKIGAVSVQQLQLPPEETTTKTKSKKAQPKEIRLFVQVILTNIGFDKVADYSGWSAATMAGDPLAPKVRDSTNRVLKPRVIPAEIDFPGQVRRATLFPGKTVEDTLIFEQPSPKASYVRIELPAGAFGGNGTLKWQIPMSMIIH